MLRVPRSQSPLRQQLKREAGALEAQIVVKQEALRTRRGSLPGATREGDSTTRSASPVEVVASRDASSGSGAGAQSVTAAPEEADGESVESVKVADASLIHAGT
jgi:hypothetical protein